MRQANGFAYLGSCIFVPSLMFGDAERLEFTSSHYHPPTDRLSASSLHLAYTRVVSSEL